MRDFSAPGRLGGERPMLQRAATERFHGKRTEPIAGMDYDPARPSMMARKSLSASNMQDKANEVGHKYRNTSSPGAGPRKMASLAFGISRQQAHYTPKVIRKSNRVDVQTGGETYREVICQRIIDYPLAMNPAERRRKLMMRTENNEFRLASVHGDVNDPQFRLQSNLHSHAVRQESNQVVNLS
jgi:hypothetical protein